MHMKERNICRGIICYVCPEDSEELKRHLAFRDYLRTHQAAREAYGKAKSAAAKLYPDDIDKYIEYKSPIIEEIYADMQANLPEELR